MLVLQRKERESIVIGRDIVVEVVEIRGDKVRLGITAPKDVTVHRQEVFDIIQATAYAANAQNTPETESVSKPQQKEAEHGQV